MANAEKVPKAALAAVVGQINQRIAGVARNLLNEKADPNLLSLESSISPRSEAQPVVQKIDLGETFAVWVLAPEQIYSGARQGEDLVKLAADTGHWHHQIRFEGKGMAYARSMRGDENEGNESWRLCELGVSVLAEEIQAAAEWSDANMSDDYVMRLLMVPSRQVRAFWFIDEAKQTSSVYIITAPPYFKKLRKKTRMSSSEFLTALASEREISGYH
jgi:hypothetical protein